MGDHFPGRSRLSWTVLLAGLLVGLAAFAYYYASGVTTAHYDAKAHLLVARRVFDSPSPGYAQLGAHWLPLAHLVYLPLVAFESQYRTGLLPSLLSVLFFALSAWLVFRIGYRATGKTGPGLLAAALLIANPNLQYLATCPLTEPLFMFLMLAGTNSLMSWREKAFEGLPWTAAAWASLGALCRYEGWFFLGGVSLVLLLDGWTGRMEKRKAVASLILFVLLFTLPAALHFGYIHAKTGDSFLQRVVRGNPAPYETWGRPILSTVYHVGEVAQVATVLGFLAGIAGTVLCLSRLRAEPRWLPLLLLWLPSLINIAALYWGLVYRVRYSVLLIPAVAVFSGLLLVVPRVATRVGAVLSLLAMVFPWVSWSFPQEWRYYMVQAGPGRWMLPLAALVLYAFIRSGRGAGWSLGVLCVAAMYVPAFAGEVRPMLSETFEHESIEAQRTAVLEYWARHYDGTVILTDIGKSAPLVYDSRLPLKRFVYGEGDLSLWHAALQSPKRVAGWILVSTGDELWHRLQVDPNWADGYALALQNEYFQLYRLRTAGRTTPLPAGRLE